MVRRVAAGMAFVAATLAVASALHLPNDAGIAEALIGVVLAGGAATMLASPRRARAVGLAATGFAIAGFLVGITETVEGGHAPDIAYHATMLPLLVLLLVSLLRTGSSSASLG